MKNSRAQTQEVTTIVALVLAVSAKASASGKVDTST